jgi:hypothetical protein
MVEGGAPAHRGGRTAQPKCRFATERLHALEQRLNALQIPARVGSDLAVAKAPVSRPRRRNGKRQHQSGVN